MKSFVDEVANWVTITSAFFVWPLLSLIGIVILLIRPGLRRQVVSTIRRLPFLTTLQRQFDQDPGNGRIAAKLILKQPSTERGIWSSFTTRDASTKPQNTAPNSHMPPYYGLMINQKHRER